MTPFRYVRVVGGKGISEVVMSRVATGNFAKLPIRECEEEEVWNGCQEEWHRW
jgi:hypothetical protein